jgi:hypothetical protein
MPFEKATLHRIEGGNPGSRYTIINEAFGRYSAKATSRKKNVVQICTRKVSGVPSNTPQQHPPRRGLAPAI